MTLVSSRRMGIVLRTMWHTDWVCGFQTQKVFESAFREFGLPHTIRTDNATPFSALAAGGLSRLAVW